MIMLAVLGALLATSPSGQCVDAVIVGTLQDQAVTEFPAGDQRPPEPIPDWNTRWLLTVSVERVLLGKVSGQKVQIVSFHHAQMRSGYKTEWRLRQREDGTFDRIYPDEKPQLCKAGA